MWKIFWRFFLLFHQSIDVKLVANLYLGLFGATSLSKKGGRRAVSKKIQIFGSRAAEVQCESKFTEFSRKHINKIQFLFELKITTNKNKKFLILIWLASFEFINKICLQICWVQCERSVCFTNVQKMETGWNNLRNSSARFDCGKSRYILLAFEIFLNAKIKHPLKKTNTTQLQLN